MVANWRHHPAVVEQWSKVICALTSRYVIDLPSFIRLALGSVPLVLCLSGIHGMHCEKPVSCVCYDSTLNTEWNHFLKIDIIVWLVSV